MCEEEEEDEEEKLEWQKLGDELLSWLLVVC